MKFPFPLSTRDFKPAVSQTYDPFYVNRFAWLFTNLNLISFVRTYIFRINFILQLILMILTDRETGRTKLMHRAFQARSHLYKKHFA